MAAPALADDAPDPASEQYRPYLHFSPERNWMNDPNGMVYVDGTWHLFFQHNPAGTRWGNMSWGHATSTDLVHWEEQPLAIPQTFDANGTAIEDIFSGSVVYDEANTSGLGTAENPPLIAIYTSAYTGAHPTHAGTQAQSLAYSLDRGQTWTKYDGNPVYDRNSANFRDPKVFRYTNPATGESYWVMAAVEATSYQVILSRSDDLKAWTQLSTFGPANATGGIWECPDLFPLAVDGDPANTKWVLVVNLNPGAPNGGSGGQYFVGDFDGTTFTSESTVSADQLPEGTVFAGFDDGTYEGWTVSNEPGNWKGGPWGAAPAAGSLPGQNPVSGHVGAGLVNGFNDGDWPVGTLESPTFAIADDYVNLLVGGGNHPHVEGAQLGNEPPEGSRLLFDGFEFADGTTLADTGWTITGDFATDPARNPSTAGGDSYLGAKRLNTWEGGPKGDDNVGDLTSTAFTIEPGEGHLSFLLGGGKRTDGTLEAQLLVDGQVVRSATGPEAGALNWRSWDVSEFAGREATFRVHDAATGGWGHLTVDHVVLAASPAQVRSDETTVNLVVDGEVVRTATGSNSEGLDWRSWDVSEYVGREASVRIVDNNRSGWGHVLVDQVMFADAPATPRVETYDWLDWGRDYYATVSFNDAPDGRRVMLGWMNDWDYAQDIPTGSWRSAMALPREVALVTTPEGPRLTQQVVPEFAQLEQADRAWSARSRAIAEGATTLPVSGDRVRIDAVIDPGTADASGLTVLGDDDAATRIGYDATTGRLFVDRRDSGVTGFHPAFASLDDVAVPLADGRIAFTVYVDRSSVEVFTADGLTTITDQVFPNAGADRIGLFADGGSARLDSLTVTPLHGAMWKEAGVDGATSAPPAAELSSTSGPKSADKDGKYLVKVKVGKGQPTTVVRLIEDGTVIGRVYRTTGSDRMVEFPVVGAAPGAHRYTVELENSAGVRPGGEITVRVAG
ncbi:GH32 C-terminal domain-containing protein [Agromyces sp. MMS24-K17]|uniref:GH32 C-terminal domain-containing protein n=1 Tax=Agromyces sp. MMS24-K17 TaxID=3372850 RepID=UPI003755244F